MISVDMWGKKNEWVRYRSHWSDVIDNLRILDDTGDNINPRLSACVHALNIFDIPDMAENCLNAGFKKVGNIYEAIVALEKRSNQIGSELKEELIAKLDEFATHNDSLDEIFENKEQIEVSKFYEKLPKPTLIAIRELLDDELFIRASKEA